ncbi:MAG: translation initiation factor IF-3 [Odoribacteraceae bacterium]|jgi:translation initiation factor IF-3|nr:translation initiation factor IF-3 [Odoribacteraceae bacterium]
MENRGLRGQHEKPQQHKINEQIKVATVRVVGENVTAGVYPLREALAMAEAAGADLVEISPTAEPPVCRIIDYSKFLYQLKKKQKEIKAKSVKVVVKEIRFGPQTDEHDFNFKLKHAVEFLQEGAKVRAYVFFRGRSILFKDQGTTLLERFTSALEEYGKIESPPKLEGKKMIVVIAPKK